MKKHEAIQSGLQSFDKVNKEKKITAEPWVLPENYLWPDLGAWKSFLK